MTTSADPTATTPPEPAPSPLATAINKHHQELHEKLTTFASDVDAGLDSPIEAERVVALNELTDFLTGELKPHAEGEERALYPAVDPLVAAHGSATATMRVDHEHIAQRIRRIGELAEGLREAPTPAARKPLAAEMRRQLTGLEAIFALHLEKEERVYLPLIERYVPPAEQERILDDVHGAPAIETTADGAVALDVRKLPPAQRHERVFAHFEALSAGESFVLINDHDPKPLYYQMSAEHPGILVWEYVEKGPSTWRVRIGKRA